MRSRMNFLEYRVNEFTISKCEKKEDYHTLSMKLMLIINGNWLNALQVRPTHINFQLGKHKHVLLGHVGLMSIEDFITNRALYKKYLRLVKLGRGYA